MWSKIQGRGGGLLLAMGVVDQNLVQMVIDLVQPTLRSFGLQTEHEIDRRAFGVR